jgi:hypothetical protein
MYRLTNGHPFLSNATPSVPELLVDLEYARPGHRFRSPPLYRKIHSRSKQVRMAVGKCVMPSFAGRSADHIIVCLTREHSKMYNVGLSTKIRVFKKREEYYG